MDPTPQQVQIIKDSSAIVEEELAVSNRDGECHMNIDISSNDVCLIEVLI